MTRSDEVRLESLLGRRVLAGNNRLVGRIEECRAVTGDGRCVVSAFVIGAAGLVERLNVGIKLLLGRRIRGYVARADQISVSDPVHPRLTCAVSDLERL